MTDLTFDLTITDTGDHYTLHATTASAAAGPLRFDPPFDLTMLRQRRADVAAWVRQAAVPRRGTAEEVRQANELGRRLFEQVFVGEVRDLFATTRNNLPVGARLRLRLRLPPALEALPWELLYDAERRSRLALDPRLGLVRRPAPSLLAPPVPIDGPLKVVAVAANPADPDLHAISADLELQRLEEALRELRDQGRVNLDLIRGRDTLGKLRNRLRYPQRNPVHILHIICHGRVDGDEGELLFEDADGLAEPVSADYLQTLLAWQEGLLRLVALNACQGAAAAEADPLGSVAAALLRAGAPAVVAMQFDIPDDAARELTRVFYGSVVAGAPADLALTEARQHLFHTFRGRLDWVVPVLYLRDGDGVLFAGAPPAAPHPNPAPAGGAGLSTASPSESPPFSSGGSRGPEGSGVEELERRLQQHSGDAEALAVAMAMVADAAAPLEQRLRAARLLGEYGDPRPGVCALPQGLDDAGYWCAAFPAGEYLIAEGKQRVRLAAFRGARYPVTVWQYRQFVEAGGYQDENLWTKAGWKWRTANTRPSRWNDPDWTAANQPVVGVAWYEAMAFCEWLNRQVALPAGWRIRLPSEAEWEVAAMWDAAAGAMRGWNPPEGALWQNVAEAGIGRTAPVGLFPQGASPGGALDMAGNVWEWCASSYRAYPAQAHLPADDFQPGDYDVPLRGGSYYLQNIRSGWGARGWDVPYGQYYGWGFRVFVCSALPKKRF